MTATYAGYEDDCGEWLGSHHGGMAWNELLQGEYNHPAVRNMWDMWQAARHQSAAPAEPSAPQPSAKALTITKEEPKCQNASSDMSPQNAAPTTSDAPNSDGGSPFTSTAAVLSMVGRATRTEEGEKQSYRTQDGMPTERAVLEMEWRQMRALLAAEQPCEDKRYAERYRWLRERNWNESALFVVQGHHSLVRLGTDCPSGERLDAAIDAAIAKGVRA